MLKNITILSLFIVVAAFSTSCSQATDQQQETTQRTQTEVTVEEPMEVSASHILVDTKEEADELKKQIDAGADFAKIAQQKSKCPSGSEGGELGYFGRGRMVPEFETAAFSTEVGQVSEPIKTQFGWHIIKVNDKR